MAPPATTEVKWLKHYSSVQDILVVGDGDFSFSLALATAFGSGENLVATSLDSYVTLLIKHNRAGENVTELKRMGATVLHDVDAKKMKRHSYLKAKRFDRIVFNFPHAGFKGRESEPDMIKYIHIVLINPAGLFSSHKELVQGFFRNASYLLRPGGEIHITHKTGQPYDSWGIEQSAAESSLVLLEKAVFHKEDYPGYSHKRGDGAKCNRSFPLRTYNVPCTFKFRMLEAEEIASMLSLVAV